MLELAPNTFCSYSNLAYLHILNELNTECRWPRRTRRPVYVQFIDGDSVSQPWNRAGAGHDFILVVLVSDASRDIFRASLWADLVVSKKIMPAELKKSLRNCLVPDSCTRMYRMPEPARCSLDRLSPRERLVFEFLAEGMAPDSIATIMDISVKTVSGHKKNLLRKTGFRNFNELLLIFLKQPHFRGLLAAPRREYRDETEAA